MKKAEKRLLKAMRSLNLSAEEVAGIVAQYFETLADVDYKAGRMLSSSIWQRMADKMRQEVYEEFQS